ncbi:DNA recombination protein RmuC [Patescibacteria group bacterium]
MSDPAFILILFLVFACGVLVTFFWFRKSKVDETQSEAIRDLERRLTDLMIGQLKEIRGSVDGTSKAMNEQIFSFTKETTKLREELKQVQNAVKDVSSFQEIFKSPKLRGQWGEASLEHILGQHFPAEFYKTQHLFSSGEQVDAILKLPNGRILPIDAKFPLENFSKMVESETAGERVAFQKQFVEDVKSRIQEISSKYILPSEDTVDFALMYIPAEAVYYEIVNNIGKDFDLTNYAWSKRIILTSPNTIYLTLRTIEHWFKDTQVSRQTQEILKRLNRIHKDAEKLADSFRKLGSHLRNTVSAYDNSEKRLSLFSERVERLLETDEKKQLKKGE